MNQWNHRENRETGNRYPPYRELGIQPMDDELLDVFLSMDSKEELNELFIELLTSAEREDISLRWKLLRDLHQKMPQRKIAEKYRISLCKITRGSKILKQKDSIILKLLERLSSSE